MNMLRNPNKYTSTCIIFPCNSLPAEVGNGAELTFLVYQKQDYQLSSLSTDEQQSCLYHIARGIRDALDELHTKF